MTIVKTPIRVKHKNKPSKPAESGWDKAIEDAKEKIKSLEFSIGVFEQSKREGRPWPETEAANLS